MELSIAYEILSCRRYTSRALTETEQRYAQIEKELLAVVFACEKFHHYIYGRPITVESDHKPLETIMKKPLQSAPLRLQKMLLRLQRYDINLVYRKGAQLYIADTLSRAYLSDSSSKSDETDDFEVMTVLAISDERKSELVEHTKNDKTLQLLRKYVQDDWPGSNHIPRDVKPYHAFRDELSVNEGIVFKGERPIIPEKLRPYYLRQLHRDHASAESCKSRARETVFWPGMCKQLDELISGCGLCNSLKNHQQKEPLILHKVPNRPWSIVGADLFEFDKMDYLIVADSYSGWFEIDNLDKNTLSRSVIQKLKEQFARHGIPDTVFTDNGPQFTSNLFKVFAKDYGFKHKTSSPTYPNSNGLVERTVQIAKRILEKAKRSGSDPYLGLLVFRNTPRDSTLGSPAQRLMSRRTRTTLPIDEKLLFPQTLRNDVVHDRLKEKRMQQKRYYDTTAKPLKPLSAGDVVRVQTDKGYDRKGTVVQTPEQTSAPKSYIVNVNGNMIRRNRRHILKTSENPPPVAEPEPVEQPVREPAPEPEPVEQPVRVGEPVQNEQNPPANCDNAPPLVTTRSGRVSRPNPKYKDFVRY